MIVLCWGRMIEGWEMGYWRESEEVERNLLRASLGAEKNRR